MLGEMHTRERSFFFFVELELVHSCPFLLNPSAFWGIGLRLEFARHGTRAMVTETLHLLRGGAAVGSPASVQPLHHLRGLHGAAHRASSGVDEVSQLP